MNIYFFNSFSNINKNILEKLIQALPQQRREYNDRLKTEKSKLYNALAFILLRYALIKEKGVDLYEIGDFIYGEKGKPYLPKTGIDFSISHSDAGIICAVSEGRDTVGVDIEAVRDYNDKIMKRVCCEEEIDLLSKERDNKASLFCEMWVKKEAYSKMTGNGFSEGFKDINTLSEKNAGFFTVKREDCFIGASLKGNESSNKFEIIETNIDEIFTVNLYKNI